MSLSMHQASVPVFRQLLNALAGVLEKAAAHCASSNSSPAEMLKARLAPDMFTLTQQVQRTCAHAAGAVARLAGRAVPQEADDESTFDALAARIARTVSFIESVEAAELEGSETRSIEQPTRVATLKFRGDKFLLGFALPQFFFHVTAAYAIVRHLGVEVGKLDYMGQIPKE